MEQEALSFVKEQIFNLTEQVPQFGEERVAGAMADYHRLSVQCREHLRTIDKLEDVRINPYVSPYSNDGYRKAILRLMSWECAAGASAQRCHEWFSCLARLAVRIPVGETAPFDVADALICFALAGDFSVNWYASWPQQPGKEATSTDLLYALMLGRQTNTPEQDLRYHDMPHWHRLYTAISNYNHEEVAAAAMALADYWYTDYQVNELPMYDPENYPCFEPDCNAIMAVALHREKIPVSFPEKYERFYIAAFL